jgi:hypothetical protein
MDQKEEITFSDHLKKLETDYKILWSYYQCMQSLMRSLLKPQRIENVNFDTLYDEFKSLESVISQIPENEIRERLSNISNHLQRYKYILYQFDEKVPPSLTRRFIEKLEEYDIRFLIYFSQFYLKKTFLTQDDWDKIDLIFTKLFIIPDSNTGFYRLRDQEQIRLILSIITKEISLPQFNEAKINEVVTEFAAITKEIKKVSDFSNLLEWGLLARVRDFKKSLKNLMLQPDVLIAMLTLNKTSKNKFIALYRDEINKIGAGIEQIDRLGESLEQIKEISPPSALPEIFPEEEIIIKPHKEPEEELHNINYEIKLQLEKILNILNQMQSSAEKGGVLLSSLEQEGDKFLEIPAFLKPYLEKMQKDFEGINWKNTLSEIIKQEPVRSYQLESWELEAFQELYVQSQPEPFKTAINKALFRATLLRKSSAELAEKLIAADKKEHDVKGNDFNKLSKLIDAHLYAGSVYIKQLKDLINVCQQKEFYMLSKYLNRAMKKLERAQTGLWLVYDEHIDAIGSSKVGLSSENLDDFAESVKVNLAISTNKKKKKS